MTIENRFALVTVRIPVEDFATEDELNVWPPGDWPKVIADSAQTHVENKTGFYVVNSQMEGEIYKPSKHTFYVVWNVMGSMIAQYLEWENDPPSVKDIQASVDDLSLSVMKTYEAAGEPLQEPPSDILLFYFNRVSGRPEDAVPDNAKRSKGDTQSGDEVEGRRQSGDLQSRRNRRSRSN